MRLSELKKVLGESQEVARPESFGRSHEFTDIEIKDIRYDSRQVKRGALFVAIKGSRYDGHDFVEEAVSRGAVAVVGERLIEPGLNLPQLVVKNSRQALASLSACFYGFPTRKIKVIGVTGTNGKTTTTHLLFYILRLAGFGVGLIGTIYYRIDQRSLPAPVTTPESRDLQCYLAEMVAKGLDYAVAEVSSHALDQGRVREVNFSAAVFTNLAPEHLDYHPSFEDYREIKASLFRNLSPRSFACINIDDEAAGSIMDKVRAKVITFGLKKGADISASIEAISLLGTDFLLRTPSGNALVRWGFLGRHNVYNALAAVACAWGLGLDVETIKKGLEAAEPVPGRLEKVDCGQDFTVLVDYAHTDHALRAVLSMLREIAPGRILLVFGCGGDRDRSKRPRMGRVAEELTDYFWLTNDNPRSEEPLAIIKDIRQGINSRASCAIEPERRRAIEAALSAARPGDIVLIAGKGHERRQIFKDEILPFDDRQVAREILSRES